MDTLSKEKRSWNMSRIRSRNTAPERQIRRLISSLGYRYRLNQQKLPGKPDIVLKKYKAVIFIHGCFWHRHSRCKYAYVPKTRKSFWMNKFRDNTERDKLVKRILKKEGWRILRLWECEIERDPEKSKKKIKQFLDNLK